MTQGTVAGARLTEDEAALYDRQIRLWGVQAQQRLRNANILVLICDGAVSGGLALELCKNIVLAGIGSLAIRGGSVVRAEDLAALFYANPSDIGKHAVPVIAARLRLLNPRVVITTDITPVGGDDSGLTVEYLSSFTAVCVIGGKQSFITRVNDLCRSSECKSANGESILFYAADAFGFYGYIYNDLQSHHYEETREETAADGTTSTVKVRSVEEYNSFASAVTRVFPSNLSIKKLRNQISPVTVLVMALWQYETDNEGKRPAMADVESFAECLKGVSSAKGLPTTYATDDSDLVERFVNSSIVAFGPTNSIVGGMLAQELIRAVSHSGLPANNFVSFDTFAATSVVNQI
ncbi:hypothetical protein GQ42DRAFT_160025 [Ramicandelaber brevisporus]|nr:hypothetical protein GQ42DRAFT_160025 [Ramicandelaber brevisporus]